MAPDVMVAGEEHSGRMLTVASTPTAFQYVECDIPEGQTLSEWRHRTGRTGRPNRRQRLLRTGR
jgi:hypothetical protein